MSKRRRYKSTMRVIQEQGSAAKCYQKYCQYYVNPMNSYPCNNCDSNKYLRSHERRIAKDHCTIRKVQDSINKSEEHTDDFTDRIERNLNRFNIKPEINNIIRISNS